jgi:CHAT domain-containing protein/tetratricopeptide (TPR) repeat protein
VQPHVLLCGIDSHATSFVGWSILFSSQRDRAVEADGMMVMRAEAIIPDRFFPLRVLAMLLQNGTRCAAAAVTALLAASFGACGGSKQSVPLSLTSIREKLQQGRNDEASELARALLRRLEESNRGDSMEAADTIDLLRKAAWLQRGCADPDAVRLCLRAIRIKQKHGKVGDPGFAVSLNSYANCLFSRGEFRVAKRFYERALKICEKTLDPNAPELARSLGNLAATNAELGDYAAARPLHERVLLLRQRNLSPGDRLLRVAHFNLGEVLEELGDYEAARSHYEWILRKSGSQPEGTDLGGVLVRLGIVHRETGDPRGAEQLYRRALQVYEASTGPESRDIAWILRELAILRREGGDREAALPLIERAVEISQKALPEDHPDVAPGLVLLADLLTDRGETKRAAALYQRALSIQTGAFGPEGLNLGPGLIGYARLQQKQGRFASALDLALRAEAIARVKFQETARGLSEREALRYDRVRKSGMEVALSLLVAAPRERIPAGALARVWDAEVRSRALVLDEMAARHRSVNETQAPEIGSLLAELDAARNRLARLAAGTEEAAEGDRHRRQIQEAQIDEDRLERAVAGKSSEFSQRLAARSVGLAEVLASLPPGGALVSYVQYGRSAAPRRGRSRSSYVALVAVAGEKGPRIVPIGGAPMVDSLIGRWKEIVSTPPLTLKGSGKGNDRDRDAGRRLRQVLWDPLPEQARHARRVFVVPDGDVHLVNFAALPDHRGARLLDSGPLLHYLSAERDLARPRRAGGDEGGFLVIGAPRFGEEHRGAPCAQDEGRTAASRPQAVRFPPIPASLDEAQAVSGLLASRIGAVGAYFLTGEEATEEAFKRLAAGRRVIHLATHAFVTGGDSAYPLQRAGMAFAGANERMCGSTGEDGILMTEEIISLDLSAAEWVVLSGCDTGLGPIQAGEGVQGLRRAFEMAGVGTLVMSLWATEDQATSDYMKQLYRERLAGAAWPETLRHASLSLIAARREAGLSTDPYYWGAFVAAGDWR